MTRQWSMKEGRLWETVRDREDLSIWHDAIHWVAESDTIWQLDNNQSAAYVTWGPPAFAGGQGLSVLSSPSPSRPGILSIAHSSPVFLSSLLSAFLLDALPPWCVASKIYLNSSNYSTMCYNKFYFTTTGFYRNLFIIILCYNLDYILLQ